MLSTSTSVAATYDQNDGKQAKLPASLRLEPVISMISLRAYAYMRYSP